MKFPEGLEVPCGQCLQCRISKRREWSARILHERGYHEKSMFLTLTYMDEKLPYNELAVLPTLRKRDLQLFIKRLRKILSYSGRRIKYFACGEYGKDSYVIQKGSYKYQTIGNRPHYHAIIFGLGLSQEDKKMVMDCWPYADWSVPKIVNGAFGLAESDSIRYVAQYIDKKLSGKQAIQEYVLKNREPVFRLLSQALGKRYAIENKDQIEQQKCITVRGQKMSIPRYYLKKTGINPDILKENAIIKESEIVANLTGLHTTVEGYRATQGTMKNIKLKESLKKARVQNNENLQAKLKLKDSKI
nr:MAG: replication initiator protein [Microviridae sp.]